ncbi:MAG: hypothetical protein A3H42_00200, partial [Deltaproteobacteria bacterium RIFCSPLOWO2_02_FULL_46_8]
ISFPRHAHPAAWIIEQYLHGKYGPPETLNPQASSILFALDRFDASDKLRSWLKEGCAIVASRYITSGLVYAAAKARPSQRRALWKWAEHLEYKIFGIPMADHTIILAVPTEVSQALLRRRAKTTKQRMDHLERNRSHQNEIFNIYQQLAATSKRRITLIDCAPQGNLLTKQEIHEKIWAVVRQKLVAGK